MNRAEAREQLAQIQLSIPGYGDGPPYGHLPPWRHVPACCSRCSQAATRRICRDGEFLCEQHERLRLNELLDLDGGSSSVGARTSWGYWLRSLYWRSYYRLTYKQGPFRPFAIRRAWYRWIWLR